MTLVFFLEELSAQVFLDGLLPRLLPPGVTYRCITFEGKQDLEKQIERRLRSWLHPSSAFIILRDQDASDCLAVKSKLLAKAANAGHPQTIVRIACRELESWHFGSLATVAQALDIPSNKLTSYAKRAKYRLPDAIVNPAKELQTITQNRYQKVSGSREIGKLIDPEANTSHSFQIFLQGIHKALAQLESSPSS
jgi:hypothetical protein